MVEITMNLIGQLAKRKVRRVTKQPKWINITNLDTGTQFRVEHYNSLSCKPMENISPRQNGRSLNLLPSCWCYKLLSLGLDNKRLSTFFMAVSTQPMRAANLHKLKVFNNNSLRSILHSWCGDHFLPSTLYRRLNLHPLSSVLLQRCLQ